MSIRRAHMATFPARIETVKIALDSLHSQVDEIHLVLNEYTEIPAFLSRFSKVNPVLPKTDYKDVGKFVPRPDAEDIVFLVDDDLQYGAQYCEWMVGQATEIGWDDNVFGLHGSIYKRANGALTRKRQLFYYETSV